MAIHWKKVRRDIDDEFEIDHIIPDDIDPEILLDDDEISPQEAAFLHGYTEDILF